jgi:hypothetical protein
MFWRPQLKIILQTQNAARTKERRTKGGKGKSPITVNNITSKQHNLE